MEIKRSVSKPVKIFNNDGVYFHFANGDTVGPFAWCDYSWNNGYLRVQKELRGKYQFLDVEGNLSPEYDYAAAYIEGKADVLINGHPFARDMFGNLWVREELAGAKEFRDDVCQYAAGRKELNELCPMAYKYPNALTYFKMIENHRLSVFVQMAQDVKMDEFEMNKKVKERKAIVNDILEEKFNLPSKSIEIK